MYKKSPCSLYHTNLGLNIYNYAVNVVLTPKVYGTAPLVFLIKEASIVRFLKSKPKLNHQNHQKVKTKRRGVLISIKFKLIFGFFVCILPIVLVGIISYNSAFNAIKDTSSSASLQTIQQVNEKLGVTFENIENLSTQIMVSAQLKEYLTHRDGDAEYEMMQSVNALTEYINSVESANKYIDSITILADTSFPFASSGYKLKPETYGNL